MVEEQLVDEDDEDTYILSKMTEVIHSLMVTYRASFLPVLDSLVPHLVRLLAPDRPWPDHQWGICVFDDVIEYAGPDSVKYQELFLRPMLDFLADKSAEVGRPRPPSLFCFFFVHVEFRVLLLVVRFGKRRRTVGALWACTVGPCSRRRARRPSRGSWT